jgi:hypothetical protein
VSIEASSFVLGVSKGRGNGVRKLILLGYANHTDKHGRGAYPSTQTIADYAECDVRTVQRHVGWLLDRGYLHEGDQRLVDHLNPRYRPIVYHVAMSSEQVHQWATDADHSGGTRTRAAEAGRRGGRAPSREHEHGLLRPKPSRVDHRVRGHQRGPDRGGGLVLLADTGGFRGLAGRCLMGEEKGMVHIKGHIVIDRPVEGRCSTSWLTSATAMTRR